jgi:hypothetical protein
VLVTLPRDSLAEVASREAGKGKDFKKGAPDMPKRPLKDLPLLFWALFGKRPLEVGASHSLPGSGQEGHENADEPAQRASLAHPE